MQQQQHHVSAVTSPIRFFLFTSAMQSRRSLRLARSLATNSATPINCVDRPTDTVISHARRTNDPTRSAAARRPPVVTPRHHLGHPSTNERIRAFTASCFRDATSRGHIYSRLLHAGRAARRCPSRTGRRLQSTTLDDGRRVAAKFFPTLHRGVWDMCTIRQSIVISGDRRI